MPHPMPPLTRAPLPTHTHAGVPSSDIVQMEWHIRGLLTDDTSAISALRCLKIYLERLGFRFLDQQ